MGKKVKVTRIVDVTGRANGQARVPRGPANRTPKERLGCRP